jgi:hypothetical protein
MNDIFFDKDDVPYKVISYDGHLRLSAYDDSWFQIEKVTHENVETWIQTSPTCFSFYRSARISDASVEGYLYEMKSLAEAILSNDSAVHYRCAVSPHEGGFVFWSPRNSSNVGWVTAKAAVTLAKEIQAI